MKRRRMPIKSLARRSCIQSLLILIRRKLWNPRWIFVPIIIMTLYIVLFSAVHEFRSMNSEEFQDENINLLAYLWMPECKQLLPSKILPNSLISCDILETNPNKLTFKMVSLLGENGFPAIYSDDIPLLPDSFYHLEINCQISYGPYYRLSIMEETSNQILPLTHGHERLCSQNPLFLYFKTTTE